MLSVCHLFLKCYCFFCCVFFSHLQFAFLANIVISLMFVVVPYFRYLVFFSLRTFAVIFSLNAQDGSAGDSEKKLFPYHSAECSFHVVFVIIAIPYV